MANDQRPLSVSAKGNSTAKLDYNLKSEGVNEVSVDWGDGSEQERGKPDAIPTEHKYENPGNYIISVRQHVEGEDRPRRFQLAFTAAASAAADRKAAKELEETQQQGRASLGTHKSQLPEPTAGGSPTGTTTTATTTSGPTNVPSGSSSTTTGTGTGGRNR